MNSWTCFQLTLATGRPGPLHRLGFLHIIAFHNSCVHGVSNIQYPSLISASCCGPSSWYRIPSSFGVSIETFAHEFGHVFGLRHFFAQITEQRWRSVLFGDHDPFSIMNYGDDSVLTDTDKADLQRLYELAWGGELTRINGTPIELQRPYHTTLAERVSLGRLDPSAGDGPARAAALLLR